MSPTQLSYLLETVNTSLPAQGFTFLGSTLGIVWFYWTKFLRPYLEERQAQTDARRKKEKEERARLAKDQEQNSKVLSDLASAVQGIVVRESEERNQRAVSTQKVDQLQRDLSHLSNRMDDLNSGMDTVIQRMNEQHTNQVRLETILNERALNNTAAGRRG
jgi:phage shock protein A